jgi:hypothetical protein
MIEDNKKEMTQEKVLKKKRHRFLVAQEIVNTERTYVSQLETLMEVFIKPMKSNNLGLTAKDFKILFNGLCLLMY